MVFNFTFNNIPVMLWQSVLICAGNWCGHIKPLIDLPQFTDKIYHVMYIVPYCWMTPKSHWLVKNHGHALSRDVLYRVPYPHKTTTESLSDFNHTVECSDINSQSDGIELTKSVVFFFSFAFTLEFQLPLRIWWSSVGHPRENWYWSHIFRLLNELFMENTNYGVV